jgi:hypothetical protein
VRTVNYAALATSAPIDKAAALARDGSGEHFDIAIPDDMPHSETPLPMKAITRQHTSNPSFADLTGTRMARLRVLGMYAAPNTKKVGMWVVRCDCGRYTARSAKAIKNYLADPEKYEGGGRCWECQRVEILKKRTATWHPWNRRSA